MNQPSQSASDTLMEEIKEAQGASSQEAVVGDGTEGTTSLPEDSGESPAVQAKAAAAAPRGKPAVDPRGVPWVDFVPEYTHKIPGYLDGCLIEHLDNLGDFLRDKESLKLSYHNQHIHDAYLGLWVRTSNRIFRNLVRLKKRRYYYQQKALGKPTKEGTA